LVSPDMEPAIRSRPGTNVPRHGTTVRTARVPPAERTDAHRPKLAWLRHIWPPSHPGTEVPSKEPHPSPLSRLQFARCRLAPRASGWLDPAVDPDAGPSAEMRACGESQVLGARNRRDPHSFGRGTSAQAAAIGIYWSIRGVGWVGRQRSFGLVATPSGDQWLA
jgi:hypothetical protein